MRLIGNGGFSALIINTLAWLCSCGWYALPMVGVLICHPSVVFLGYYYIGLGLIMRWGWLLSIAV